MQTATTPVHVELLPTACGRAIAVATLDAERSLNSLTLAMVDALLPQLAAWADDDQVVAVLLRGRGDRAFCAGGDVRALTQHARTGEGDAAIRRTFLRANIDWITPFANFPSRCWFGARVWSWAGVWGCCWAPAFVLLLKLRVWLCRKLLSACTRMWAAAISCHDCQGE